MGIYSFLNRSAKKDEAITALNEQIAAYTVKIAALEKRLEDVRAGDRLIAEGYELIVERQKEDAATIAARDERIRELEHDAAEYDVASDRYVKDIEDLNGEVLRLSQEVSEHKSHCSTLFHENEALLTFVQKVATGTNIRTDKPGGMKLVEQAKALLKQYAARSDKQVLSE